MKKLTKKIQEKYLRDNIFSTKGIAMRSFGILLVVAFAAYLTPMEARNQRFSPSIEETDTKIYVNPENFYFGSEGIFWQVSQDNWVPVSSVHHDSDGIYLTKEVLSWTYYVCTSCGKNYKRQPSECTICGGTSFERRYDGYHGKP